MSQQNVIKLLEKQPDKWFSSKEIAKAINVTSSVISANLSKLYKQGVVHRKTIINFRKSYLWRIA